MAPIQLISIMVGHICLQEYRSILRNTDGKEICSFADCCFVLRINKLVNTQEMCLGIYHQC